jgi:putative spermidine/putrescine transport system substrate-binding protein
VITKRGLLTACAAAVAMTVVAPMVAEAAPALRVLAWDGYADKDWVQEFEKETNSKVDVVFIGSDAELWAKIDGSNGQDADLIAVNTGQGQRYISAGLLQPLDLSKIPNHATQDPEFADLTKVAGTMRDGKAYLLPYAFGPNNLFYDPSKVSPAPTSWDVLWDPKYKGQVITYDDADTNISVAALASGITTPYDLTQAQLTQMKARLIDLKHQLAGFYAFSQDSVQLAQNNDVALMLGGYGDAQLRALKEAGLNFVSTVPSQGIPAWLDTWAITTGAKGAKYDLALKWINFMISKKAGQELTDRTGYGNTATGSSTLGSNAKLIWVKPVESESERSQIWNEVKASP